MGRARQAATGRRKIWEGHDKEKGELIRTGAEELYSVISNANECSLQEAGKHVEDAFWMADEAEQYQETGNKLMENQRYIDATEHLKTARYIVELPVKPMEHRCDWWKAYRREDKPRLLYSLAREQISDIGFNSTSLEATRLLLDAAKTHDENNWDSVDDTLEDYYEITLPYIQSQ
jgi:hypothetical protein